MKKGGEMLMTVGAFIFVIGCCALDTDGPAYGTILLIIMLGVVIAIAGYGLTCMSEYFSTKKIAPYVLWRAGAIKNKS